MFAHLRNSMKELIWNYGSSQEILNKKLAYLVGVENKKHNSFSWCSPNLSNH